MFIASVMDAKVLSDSPSITYAYYQQNIKPKPAAAQPASSGKKRWVCEVCGYVYEGEELPDDYICPICKHGKSDFKLIEA
jgi:rubredoxin